MLEEGSIFNWSSTIAHKPSIDFLMSVWPVFPNIQIITKERTKDGLNKKSTFCALLIQDIFGFSELNKVASCMGILLIYLYSIFPINE